MINCSQVYNISLFLVSTAQHKRERERIVIVVGRSVGFACVNIMASLLCCQRKNADSHSNDGVSERAMMMEMKKKREI